MLPVKVPSLQIRLVESDIFCKSSFLCGRIDCINRKCGIGCQIQTGYGVVCCAGGTICSQNRFVRRWCFSSSSRSFCRCADKGKCQKQRSKYEHKQTSYVSTFHDKTSILFHSLFDGMTLNMTPSSFIIAHFLMFVKKSCFIIRRICVSSFTKSVLDKNVLIY